MPIWLWSFFKRTVAWCWLEFHSLGNAARHPLHPYPLVGEEKEASRGSVGCDTDL